MLERQQQNLLAWPDRPLVKLKINAGGELSREVIDRLLAGERARQAGRPVMPTVPAKEAPRPPRR